MFSLSKIQPLCRQQNCFAELVFAEFDTTNDDFIAQEKALLFKGEIRAPIRKKELVSLDLAFLFWGLDNNKRYAQGIGFVPAATLSNLHTCSYAQPTTHQPLAFSVLPANASHRDGRGLFGAGSASSGK